MPLLVGSTPDRSKKGEVVRAVVPETLGEVLRFDPQSHSSSGLENLLLDTQHVPPPTLLRAGFPPMPKAKQHLDLVQELVAEAASHGIGQRCEKLHVADQMHQQNCSLASVSAVKRRYSPA